MQIWRRIMLSRASIASEGARLGWATSHMVATVNTHQAIQIHRLHTSCDPDIVHHLHTSTKTLEQPYTTHTPKCLSHDAAVSGLMPPLIPSNGATQRSQRLVAMLQCLPGGVAVADLGRPLLCRGVWH